MTNDSKTKIKLCGMRSEEDIMAVNKARPDCIGYILTDRFWRYIPQDLANAMTQSLAPCITPVGVFVDESIDYIMDFVKKGIIKAVQLHGKEDNDFIEELKIAISDYEIGLDFLTARDLEKNAFRDVTSSTIPVIKAFQVKNEEVVEEAKNSIADIVLLDSGTGSGKVFDWSLIQDMERPFILAGGLSPSNLADVVKGLHPYMVDLSSGVETEKVKDPEKITAAVKTVR